MLTPTPTAVGPGVNVEEAMRGFRRDLGIYTLEMIVLQTLTVIAGVWLCILAERILNRPEPTPFGPVPVASGAPAGGPGTGSV